MSNKQRIKIARIGIAIFLGMFLIITLGISLTGCSSWNRSMKSFQSDMTGGLSRTVTVYNSNGEVIKTYTGQIDVQDTQYGNKVLFDLNGKRVIIYNATVTVEEN